MTTENTSPEEVQEKPETPTANTKKWYHTSWKSVSSLHPAWYISIGLTLLLASLIVHYEYREYRTSSFGGFANYGRYDHSMNHSNRFENTDNYERYPWDMFDRQMEYMERRHNRMMRQMGDMMQNIPPQGNGQYTGFRSVNNSNMNYSFNSNNGKVNGTITTTGSGGFGNMRPSIEKLGYSVTGNTGALTISGTTDKLPELMNLIEK
ncbi:MAG: hypothetical protein PHY14_01570 [Candidatus Gracilibacteria bacterium]|nr:hypothetical protein [Candidatus Gracilibacteria bacterium]